MDLRSSVDLKRPALLAEQVLPEDRERLVDSVPTILSFCAEQVRHCETRRSLLGRSLLGRFLGSVVDRPTFEDTLWLIMAELVWLTFGRIWDV